MSSSELSEVSSLSSAESLETDDEILNPTVRTGNLDAWLKRAKSSPSPPPKKRAPSPPHEYVLEDNPDIAFIVMFRARFSDAFPRSCPQLGPQDIERGVVDTVPDESVEKLLCCLLGLVLNRKKEVEKGHYMRALEEAIQSNQSQWPKVWQGQNPLHGGGTFNSMAPTERLTLLRALVLWALNSSDIVQKLLKESYKQQRHEDDLNQPLSVQPWGRDGYKRRYWLIEGRDDTHFRVYRESNPALKTNTWWSVADSIETAKEFADKLQEEGSQAARRLHDQLYAAIPRFEAGEEKRKRREYRLARRAAFTRPEPGFSLYEGRTRGKRVKYTFSDNEDEGDASDAMSARRSARISGISTPAEPAAPTVTASGRQVRSRVGGVYGETMHSGQQTEIDAVRAAEDRASEDVDDERAKHARSSRSAMQGRANGRSSRLRYNDVDDMDDESDATSSGNEWDGGDDEDEDAENRFADDDDDNSEVDQGETSDEDVSGMSLVVSLKVSGAQQRALLVQNEEPLHSSEPPLDSITIGEDRTKTPEAQTAPSAPVAGSQPMDEDKMDMTLDGTASPKPLSNGVRPSTTEEKQLPNGILTSNFRAPYDLEQLPHPLQRETKLPFSPSKRESPTRPVEPSLSQTQPASSTFTTPSTSSNSFATHPFDTSTTPTTQVDETQHKLMDEHNPLLQQVLKTDDVPMT